MTESRIAAARPDPEGKGLPEVPMTDDEVGVEIVFLEPDDRPAEEAARFSAGPVGWDQNAWVVRHA